MFLFEARTRLIKLVKALYRLLHISMTVHEIDFEKQMLLSITRSSQNNSDFQRNHRANLLHS